MKKAKRPVHKRILSAIMRRKLVSAGVALAIAIASSYGFGVSPEVRKALDDLLQVLNVAF